MTKSELVNALAVKFNNRMDPLRVHGAVHEIIDYLSETLSDGNKIEVRGFGSFSVRERAARIGRNPKTGEQIEIVAKRVTHFKPGKELRSRVNGGVETSS